MSNADGGWDVNTTEGKLGEGLHREDSSGNRYFRDFSKGKLED